MEGIDLFVKILVFVKILSQCTRKEGRKEGRKISIFRSARASSIALKNAVLDQRTFLSSVEQHKKRTFNFRVKLRILQGAFTNYVDKRWVFRQSKIFDFLSTCIRQKMLMQGGLGGQKRQKLVNVVSERPLILLALAPLHCSITKKIVCF